MQLRTILPVVLLTAASACGGNPPPAPVTLPTDTITSPVPPETAKPAESAKTPIAPATSAAPSQEKPVEAAPAPTTSSSAPPPPANVEHNADGKIVSHASDKLTLQLDGDLPAVGATAELSRKLDEALPLMPAGTWLTIAAVKVEKVEGKKVTLTITERKSLVTINGRQIDHFKPRTSIRLVWTTKP